MLPIVQSNRLVLSDPYNFTGILQKDGVTVLNSDETVVLIAATVPPIIDAQIATAFATFLTQADVLTNKTIDGNNNTLTVLTSQLSGVVALANGGTNASSASAARVSLGLQIGVDVQAFNSNLNAWAAKTAPSGTVVGTTDSQILTNKTISGTANTISNIDLGSQVTGNLPVSRLNNGTGASATTVWRGNETWDTIENTIPDGAILFQKIEDISPGMLLGRDNSGGGQMQEITLGDNLSLTGTILNASIAGGTSVTAAANLTDHAVIVGSGGAKGVASLAALGAAGTVLTSNGAGVDPSFQTISSGPSPFDATVGSAGADYTTISGALAASKSRLLVLANVTETADCAIPSGGLYIYIEKGKTVDFATNSKQFTRAGAYNLVVDGQDKDLCLFNYGFGSSKNLVDGSTGVSSFNRVHVTNSSTADLTAITNGSPEEHYNDVIVTAANQNVAGIAAYNPNSTLSNVQIIGGGAACDNALDLEAALRFNNINVTGTFKAGGGIYMETLAGTNLTFNNSDVYCTIASSAVVSNISSIGNSGVVTLELKSDVQASNVFVDNTGDTIKVSGVDTGLTNFECDNFTMTAFSRASHYSNGFINTMTFDAGANECDFSALHVSNAATIDGDLHSFSGVKFLGGATVVSGANNNAFVISQFGASAGGGVLTLTIASGALNTQVGLSKSDVAMVNGDASSVLSANVIF